ncbi:MAG: hypothetical protein CMA92_01395 [Euryarchaeota archaeon]|nr:hypothetical protein [Euryarchaeota archaeon]|tara:strand:- start:1732 stop:2463 length:732 start_codon:yes stop_codon:yes gene_type:complete
MFFEESSTRWLLILFEFIIAIILIMGSKSQPFPNPSRRLGSVLLLVATLFLIGQSAPRPASVNGHMAFLSIIGALGLIFGVHHMLNTRREVLVAPMSGFLFCVGVGGLMIQTWSSLSTIEQWSGFLALVVLSGGQVWLVFRGLLIGRLPLAWSQAGMVALSRGQISGEHGAISCFEKAWDVDEEHLNPMAYVALHRIHEFLGDKEEAEKWFENLIDSGGEDAVAPEWIEAIENSLSNINDRTE